MKILHIIQYMAPEMGGPLASIATLAKGLIKRGHSVEICTTDYKLETKHIKNLRAEGIKLRTFKSHFGHLYYCPSCKEYFEKNVKKFDVIHLNNHWSYLNIVAHNYAKKYSVPYVFSARGSFPIKQFGSRNFLLKWVYEILWGRHIVKDASKLIALTRTEKRQYSSRTDKKDIVIASNPINTKGIRRYAKFTKGNFKEGGGINKSDKILLYIGRLHKRKGIDLLIKAFALASKKIKNVKLLIVGPDDGFQHHLEKVVRKLNIKEKVIFTGYLFGKDKIRMYCNADIFISPARYEPFGITFLEAMAFGLPIITINNVGLADTIKNKCGLVVNYNQKELCDAILKLLSDGNIRKRMGKTGKKIVKQFDSRKIAKQMERVYLDVVKMHGKNKV